MIRFTTYSIGRRFITTCRMKTVRLGLNYVQFEVLYVCFWNIYFGISHIYIYGALHVTCGSKNILLFIAN